MLSPQQKRRFRKIALFSLIIAMLIAAGWGYYQWRLYQKAKFTRYKEFGIAVPNGYTIHGIDVSKYQSIIAWEEVKAMKVKNIRFWFAFIKATQGAGSTDPHFFRNWKKSKEAEMVRGAYHFFIASKDGQVQAENFIDKVDLETGDLPPVLDIEQLNGVSPQQLRKEAKKWLDVVEKHYGVKPIIYTNVDFYTSYLGEEFDEYPFWAAHYKSNGVPRIGRPWSFWQHSDRGHVNGITAEVDFNVFNGDSMEFVRLLIR
jgi:lysozyme